MSHLEEKKIDSTFYKTVPTEKSLDFWIQNNLNVLFRGKHGVGKTTIILDAFKRNNLKYKSFSGATMDPWVDFVGVPKEKTDEKGSYLDLVRPKDLRDHDIEAIFIDEFNRTHKKVRNAVMELIQNKSINGHKFNNLKVVWAAINPDPDNNDNEEHEYDVEKLDPAQEDRFEIRIDLPYDVDKTYFATKYGEEIGETSCQWWDKLPKNIKNHISPRRLDYALAYFVNKGNIEEILPSQSNPKKLINDLNHGSPIKVFKKLHNDFVSCQDEAEKINLSGKIKLFIKNENNYQDVKDFMLKEKRFDPALYFLHQDKISSLFRSDSYARDFILENCMNTAFSSVIKSKFETETVIDIKILEKLKNAYDKIIKDEMKHRDNNYQKWYEEKSTQSKNIKKVKESQSIGAKKIASKVKILETTETENLKKIADKENLSTCAGCFYKEYSSNHRVRTATNMKDLLHLMSRLAAITEKNYCIFKACSLLSFSFEGDKKVQYEDACRFLCLLDMYCGKTQKGSCSNFISNLNTKQKRLFFATINECILTVSNKEESVTLYEILKEHAHFTYKLVDHLVRSKKSVISNK